MTNSCARLQAIADVSQKVDVNQAREQYTKAIVGSDQAVEKDLMSPLLGPFMHGVLGKLAEGGWKSEMAMGVLKKIFGGCFGASAKPPTPVG
jgi:hypothetical protein